MILNTSNNRCALTCIYLLTRVDCRSAEVCSSYERWKNCESNYSKLIHSCIFVSSRQEITNQASEDIVIGSACVIHNQQINVRYNRRPCETSDRINMSSIYHTIHIEYHLGWVWKEYTTIIFRSVHDICDKTKVCIRLNI